MKNVSLAHELEYPILMEKYQLDVHSLPLDIKSKLTQIRIAIATYGKVPTLANKKEILLQDDILSQSINNWIEDVCKVLEG